MGTLCLSRRGNQKLTLPTAPVPLHHTSSADGCAEPGGGVMLGSVHVFSSVFKLYLCSVDVHSWLHWFALVVAGCSRDALQPINVHYEIEVYSGICTSICPPVVMYAEFLGSRLA